MKKQVEPVTFPIGETLSTPEGLAQRMGLGVVTVKRWIKAGKIKGLKLGHNTVRIAESEIQRFLASKAT